MLMAAQDALRHTLDNLALAGDGDEDQAYRLSMLRRIGGSDKAVAAAPQAAGSGSRVIEIEYQKGRNAQAGAFSVLAAEPRTVPGRAPVEFIDLADERAFDDVAEAERFGWIAEDPGDVGFSAARR